MALFLSDKNLFFIHIPKTGGESISYWMKELGANYVDLHKHSALHHSMLPVHTYFSFCVVRNPWDRMVSMYHFAKKVNFTNKNKSFKEWLETGINYKNYWYSAKTCQVEWIRIKPNYILRYENFVKDFEIIQDLLNYYQPLPHLNKTEHDHYTHYYDDDSIKLIENIFYKDIVEFNYKF